MRELVQHALTHVEVWAEPVQAAAYVVASAAALHLRHRTLSTCYATNALMLVIICISKIS